MRLGRKVKPIVVCGAFWLIAMSLRLQGQAPPCNAAKIDINSATRQELEKLPGIGSVRAGMIIRIRETSGPFESIEELRAIPRLTDKQFEKLRCRIQAIRLPVKHDAVKHSKRGEH